MADKKAPWQSSDELLKKIDEKQAAGFAKDFDKALKELYAKKIAEDMDQIRNLAAERRYTGTGSGTGTSSGVSYYSTMSYITTPEERRAFGKPITYPIEYQSFDEKFRQNAGNMVFFVCAKCDEICEVREIIMLPKPDAVRFVVRHHGKEDAIVVTSNDAAKARYYGSPGQILAFDEGTPKKKEAPYRAPKRSRKAIPEAPMNPLGGRRLIQLDEEE